MRKQTIALFLLICLTGCGSKAADVPAPAPTEPDKTASSSVDRDRRPAPAPSDNTAAPSADSKPAPAEPDTDEEEDVVDGGGPDALRREDEDGLISVYIWPDGQAHLFFDIDRWESRHDIYSNEYFDLDQIKDGPFTIVTSGKSGVRDACIGKIDDMDMGYLSLRDFISPTVVLLMEDGSVEFLRADCQRLYQPNHPVLSFWWRRVSRE